MSSIQLDNPPVKPEAVAFCHDFIHSKRPKYVFGRNEYAASILKIIAVDGVIDDFTTEKYYNNVPIVDMKAVPPDALVVVAVVVGKPIRAEKRVSQFNLQQLDYYAFFKYSHLPLQPISYWDGFDTDFQCNRDQYEAIYDLLADSLSKQQMTSLINFRLSYDLDWMRGFKAIEDQQYFEDFLQLQTEGETFVDIGGFDGYTTEAFINRCPNYREIYFIEPEASNMARAQQRLKNHRNIHYCLSGVSDTTTTLRFEVGGSSSKISPYGSKQIAVDQLDNLISSPVTYIKMDIEGEEKKAIQGAAHLIQQYHPKLAICVYHRFDDFWTIPHLVLSIRDDYAVFLRHYTEGFAETVLFFIPRHQCP